MEAPLPTEWDAAVYTPAQSYKRRIDYAVARAQKLGAGSSRVAFDIPYQGRATVLKVAKNARGMMQNEAEADLLSDGYLNQLGIIIPLIDYDEEHAEPVWIHVEKAQKASQKQLCDLMRCGKLEWLVNAAKYAQTGRGQDHNDDVVKLYGKESLETFHHYVDLLQELYGFDVQLDDFSRAANWGLYNGSPVIIDMGFTKAVASHYRTLK
jgi:hypothetical protein